MFTPTLIGDLLERGAIAPAVTASSKRQALSVAAEIAARVWRLKAQKVFDALMERESHGATGVGHGVAIPHAHVAGLERIRGVFLRLKPPVDFGAVDEEPVDLVFALLSPPDCGSDQLRTMARVARALRSSELRQQLRRASNTDSILALLNRDATPTAA
ncbi:MAG TPA: PTS sugar transporter subunit IIA [Caulobacteraceae bacterium]|jgi:PTS system nitrogen regulatory IIA component|nr:PTS sugar transporter subunit IIA [Caulobacteraceae bacterium]